MVAPLLLLLLFIPSAYSARDKECPGGYRFSFLDDERFCKQETSYPIDKELCCPRMVSRWFKDRRIDWPPAGIIANAVNECDPKTEKEKPTCKSGEFCHLAETMRPWRTDPKRRLNLCYEYPKCHGEVSNEEIESVFCNDKIRCPEFAFCDKKMTEIYPNVTWNGYGICCIERVKCPLSDQSTTRICSNGQKCNQNEQCFSIKSGKYCCPIDKKYYCMDGSLATKVKDKWNHNIGEPFDCSGDQAKMDINGETMCCPRMISSDYQFGGIEKEPVNPEKTCPDHSTCPKDEFCGISKLVNSNQSLSISHCYPTPSCFGTVALDQMGLKFCPVTGTCPHADEICDESPFGANKGVCCSFQCGGGPLEAKAGDGKVGRVCTGCDNEKDEWSYCDKGLVNDDQQMNVCKKIGDGKYRQCTYERELASCPTGYDSPLREETSRAVAECNTDWDCNPKGTSLAVRASCIAGHHSGKKFCCSGDLCPDMWLLRKEEKSCTQDNDCQMEDSKGICDKMTSAGNQDPNGRCCPRVEDTNQGMHVDGPYSSNKNCTKLEDCIGENRFCDPYKKTCMYHKKSLDSTDSRPGNCDKDKMDCGSKQIVCMAEGQSNSPRCYRHPLDKCASNSDCQQNGKYCGLSIPAEGDNSPRECYPVPTDATLNSSVGLKLCSDNAACGSGDECSLDDTVPGVEPKSGYCRKKILRQCRGLPKLIYSQGQLKTCSANANCQSDEYCDTKATPAVGSGHGLCCSMPSDGGGEIIRNSDAGLKMCEKDDECDLKTGEICFTKFKKEANSLWKPQEGICTKMQCPTSPTTDLEMMTPVAGQFCSIEECKSDDKTLGLCVTAPGSNEKRCCRYSRKQGLCPIDRTTGKLELHPDSQARQCSGANKCPDGSDCYNGVCCKIEFCPSTSLSLKEQQKCSVAKDCEQPTGGSADCVDGHCCPKIANGEISHPFAIDDSCKEVDDCPEKRMFCDLDKKRCTYFGADKDFVTTEKCKKKEAECKLKDIAGVCVYADDDRTKDPQCWVNPLLGRRVPNVGSTTETSGKKEENSTTIIVVIVVVVVLVLLVVAGVGGFFVYKRIHKKKTAKQEKGKETKKKNGQQKQEAEKRKDNKSQTTASETKNTQESVTLTPQG